MNRYNSNTIINPVPCCQDDRGEKKLNIVQAYCQQQLATKSWQ